MNTNTIRKFKWFWAWQDEKEENWLTEMAGQGFHLKQVVYPGFYQFQIGEPENYVYRLDYQSLKYKDRESYLQLFADAGWEHIGDMTNWVYFRKKVQPGGSTEIYSDVESKIGKYQRIITYMIIFLPILLILFPSAPDTLGPSFLILEGFFLILIIIYVIAMVQLIRRVYQLKSRQ